MLNLNPSQPFAKGDSCGPLEAAKAAAELVEGWPDRLFIGPNAMAAARKLLDCQELPLFVRSDDGEPGECLGWFKAVQLDRNAAARHQAGQASSESPTSHEPRTIHGIRHMRHVSDGRPQ